MCQQATCRAHIAGTGHGCLIQCKASSANEFITAQMLWMLEIHVHAVQLHADGARLWCETSAPTASIVEQCGRFCIGRGRPVVRGDRLQAPVGAQVVDLDHRVRAQADHLPAQRISLRVERAHQSPHCVVCKRCIHSLHPPPVRPAAGYGPATGITLLSRVLCMALVQGQPGWPVRRRRGG